MDRDYYSDISELVPDSRTDKIIRIVHSVFIYCIAYITITYISHYVSGFAAKFFGLTPTVRYYGLYDLPISYFDWTKWSVLFVFGSGPVAALIVGLIAYQVNNYVREFNTNIKAYALWLSVHGVALFCSYSITGSFGTGLANYQGPFYYGFAVVATWLNVNQVLMVPITLLGILLMLVFGLLIVSAFLSLCFNRKLAINYKGRRQFLLQSALLPWIIGSAICILFSLPPNMYLRDFVINLFKNASIGFVMLGMWFRLDYIVGSIVVHSFDIFKNKLWLSAILFVVLMLIITSRHYLPYLMSL